MITKVFIVIHSYLVEDKYTEAKIIGMFSTIDNAQKAIELSFQMKGFNLYPKDCYRIQEYIVNPDMNKWSEGLKDEDFILLY